MLKLSCTFANNQSFVLSLDCSALLAVYPSLASYGFRLQLKTWPTDSAPLLEFATSGAAGSAVYNSVSNVIQFLASQSLVGAISGLKYFDIRVEGAGVGEFAAAFGTVEFVTGVTLSTASGVPNATTPSGLGDTVLIVNAETLLQPAMQPGNAAAIAADALAAAASAAAAGASAAAAAASATAASSAASAGVTSLNAAASSAVSSINSAATTAEANIASAETTAVAAVVAEAAVYMAFTQSAFNTWLAGLPTTLPASSGQLWWDGQILAIS